MCSFLTDDRYIVNEMSHSESAAISAASKLGAADVLVELFSDLRFNISVTEGHETL